MKGYKLNQGQLNAIENQSFSDGQYFNPVQDINGDWFIFQTEMDGVVKNKGWQKAMEAEYVPPPQEPIE